MCGTTTDEKWDLEVKQKGNIAQGGKKSFQCCMFEFGHGVLAHKPFINIKLRGRLCFEKEYSFHILLPFSCVYTKSAFFIYTFVYTIYIYKCTCI